MKKIRKKVTTFLLLSVLLMTTINILSVKAEDVYVPATLTDSSSGTSLEFRIDYEATSISPGDKIVVTMTPSVANKIRIVGFSDSEPIYNDANVIVGSRSFTYGDDGSCTLMIVFNDGYADQTNIEGWYTALATIQYVGNVNENEVTVKVEINGKGEFIIKPVDPGNPIGPGGTDFTPGQNFSKFWRYGDQSPNSIFQDISTDGDYTKLDTMRWYLPIGLNNLTNRDMRASGGTTYWTTPSSLAYSNNNPNPSTPYDRYTTTNESYLKYWYWAGETQHTSNVDEPFHYTDVVLDDYLDIGENYGTIRTSPHDYVSDSIRIVRVIGRDQSDPNVFLNVADNNFLKETTVTNDEIFRFSGESLFSGYRGLTIEEFFNQMKSEGQFSQYSSWEEILTVDVVNNHSNMHPDFTSIGDPSTQVPHFKLTLGDLRFSESYSGSVTGTKEDGTHWAPVSATNLPYAYFIYYDTQATGIELDEQSQFQFYNRAVLSYNESKKGTDYVPLPMKYEDSGGYGHATLKIKKVNDNNLTVPNILFTLSSDTGYHQERTTAIDGFASFIINKPGVYTLYETAPAKLNLLEIKPITFTITQAELDLGIINLENLLPSNYENKDQISFMNDITTIINKNKPEDPEKPVPPVETTDPKKPETIPPTAVSSNTMLWIFLCGLSINGIIFSTIIKKKIDFKKNY